MQYPRPHEPILPALLRPLVLAPSAGGFDDDRGDHADDVLSAFALGATAWTRLPYDTCRRLGRLVVRLVERRLPALPPISRDATLPAPAEVVTLPLEKRTINTLRRAMSDGVSPERWSLGEYLAIPRFGARALVDLLAGVEARGGTNGGAAREGATNPRARPPGVAPAADPESMVDRVLVAIVRRIPISEVRASGDLLREGLLSQPLDVDLLIRQAVRLGRKVPFRAIELAGSRVVVRLSDVTAARSACRLAQRAVHYGGVASVHAIVGRLRTMGHSTVDDVFMQRLLEGLEDFEWLDHAGGWFWFVKRANPLLDDLRRILSVVTQVTFPRLSVALRRGRTGPVPPPRVIQQMCAGLPGWRITDGSVTIDRRLDRAIYLKNSEKRIVELMEAAGGGLTGDEIRRRVRAVGLGWAPIWKLLRTSPLFEQSDDGQFRLLGDPALNLAD